MGVPRPLPSAGHPFHRIRVRGTGQRGGSTEQAPAGLGAAFSRAARGMMGESLQHPARVAARAPGAASLGPGEGGDGVPGGAAAAAGRVGGADRRLVPRPGVQHLHQQLPPLSVALLADAAAGAAPGERGRGGLCQGTEGQCLYGGRGPGGGIGSAGRGEGW